MRFAGSVRRALGALFVLVISTSHAQFTVKDDLGREVTLRVPAARIISLAPSVTETLFAIGAGQQVVGVTNYCDFPPEATSRQKVGGMTNPNIESIVSLKPDLIALSMEGNTKQDFDNLARLKIPIFVINPRTLEGIYKSIRDLSVLTGRRKSGEELTLAMRAKSDSILHSVQRMKRKSVLLLVSLQPPIVVGRETFLHHLIELAGGENAAANATGTYPQYSREAVLKQNPDVFVLLSDIYLEPAELLRIYPEWTKLRAFQEKQVYSIDAAIASRPGPRALEGMYQLTKLIHQKN